MKKSWGGEKKKQHKNSRVHSQCNISAVPVSNSSKQEKSWISQLDEGTSFSSLLDHDQKT